MKNIKIPIYIGGRKVEIGCEYNENNPREVSVIEEIFSYVDESEKTDGFDAVESLLMEFRKNNSMDINYKKIEEIEKNVGVIKELLDVKLDKVVNVLEKMLDRLDDIAVNTSMSDYPNQLDRHLNDLNKNICSIAHSVSGLSGNGTTMITTKNWD